MSKSYSTCLCVILLFAGIAFGGDIDRERIVKIGSLLRANDTPAIEEGRRILQETNYDESQLILLLDDQNMQTKQPLVVGAAITILGEMKSTNATTKIVNMLLYSKETGRDFNISEWKALGVHTHGPPEVRALEVCTACKALRNIGQPAIRPLLDALSKGKWSGDSRSYAYFLASCVLREVTSPEAMSTALANYKNTLTDPEAQKRIDEFLVFCKQQ